MCGVPLDDWANGAYVDVSYSHVLSVGLVLLGIGPVLRSRYGIE